MPIVSVSAVCRLLSLGVLEYSDRHTRDELWVFVSDIVLLFRKYIYLEHYSGYTKVNTEVNRWCFV